MEKSDVADKTTATFAQRISEDDPCEKNWWSINSKMNNQCDGS